MNRSNIAETDITETSIAKTDAKEAGWSTVFIGTFDPIFKIYKPSKDDKEVNSNLEKVLLGIKSNFNEKESLLFLYFDFSSEKEAEAALLELKDFSFPDLISLSHADRRLILETKSKKDFFLTLYSFEGSQATDIKFKENIVSVLYQLQILGFQGISKYIFQDMKKTLGIMKSALDTKYSPTAKDIELFLSISKDSTIKWAEDLHKSGDKNVSYHLACALEKEPEPEAELAIYIFSKVPEDSEFYNNALIKMAEKLISLSSPYKKPAEFSYLEVNNDTVSEEKALESDSNLEEALSLLCKINHLAVSYSDSTKAHNLQIGLFATLYPEEYLKIYPAEASPDSSEASEEAQQSGSLQASEATFFSQSQSNNRGLEENVTAEQNDGLNSPCQ